MLELDHDAEVVVGAEVLVAEFELGVVEREGGSVVNTLFLEEGQVVSAEADQVDQVGV